MTKYIDDLEWQDQVNSLRKGGVARKIIVFDGAAHKGLQASVINLFTVTGDVRVRVNAKCATSLDSTGAPTLEIGIAGGTATIIAQTTAKNIDVDMFWNDATPGTIQADASKFLAADDIIGTVGSANIDSGQLTFYCEWEALSLDGNVVAS